MVVIKPGTTHEGADTEKEGNGEPFANSNGSQEETPENSNNLNQESNTDDNSEMLLKILMEATKKLGYQVNRTFNFIMMDLGGYQIFDRIAQWCVQHPQMAICCLAAVLVASLPVLLFVAFALSTIVMTFTGFLVLEGTLLTMLVMIMFGLMGALALIFLFFAIIGLATYFGVSHVYDMYGSTEAQYNNLRNVIYQRNGQNLPSQSRPTRNSNETSQD